MGVVCLYNIIDVSLLENVNDITGLNRWQIAINVQLKGPE